MNRKEIYEKVNNIFRDVFDDEGLEVSDETNLEDIAQWDSMLNLNLMVAIEEEFGIKFKMSEINTLRNVGKIVDIINERV